MVFTASLIIAFAVLVSAQAQTTGKNAIETKHLTIAPSVSAPTSATRVSLVLDITPKPKMHVYSPEQKDYIPISLTLTVPDGVRASQAQFPKAEKWFFEPLKETQLVYSKPFRITQPVTLTKSPAAVTINGTLRYQACDDSICYLPQNVSVTWVVAK